MFIHHIIIKSYFAINIAMYIIIQCISNQFHSISINFWPHYLLLPKLQAKLSKNQPVNHFMAPLSTNTSSQCLRIISASNSYFYIELLSVQCSIINCYVAMFDNAHYRTQSEFYRHITYIYLGLVYIQLISVYRIKSVSR